MNTSFKMHPHDHILMDQKPKARTSQNHCGIRDKGKEDQKLKWIKRTKTEAIP